MRAGGSPQGRADLLEAAASVFSTRGFTAASIDDIASALGATKGRVYHYYRSKADIFLDVQIMAMEDLLTKQRPIVQDPDRAVEAKLYEFAAMHATQMMTRSSFCRVAVQGVEMHLLGEIGADQQKAVRTFLRLRDRYEQRIADVIAIGTAEKVFRDVDPRLATKPILGALNWMNMWYQPKYADEESIRSIADEFATFVVMGLRPAMNNDRLMAATRAAPQGVACAVEAQRS